MKKNQERMQIAAEKATEKAAKAAKKNERETAKANRKRQRKAAEAEVRHKQPRSVKAGKLRESSPPLSHTPATPPSSEDSD